MMTNRAWAVLALAAASLTTSTLGCRNPDDRAGTVPPDQSDAAADAAVGGLGDAGLGAEASGDSGGQTGGNNSPPVAVSVRMAHLTPVDKGSRLALYLVGGASPLVSNVGFAAASEYQQAQLPSQGAQLAVRLASESSFASPRALALPLGTLSGGDKVTVLAVQSLDSPRLVVLVDHFGPAVAGAARVRFMSAFSATLEPRRISDGLGDEFLPDRVYTSDGGCLASLGHLGFSASEGEMLPAAAGADDFVRIWSGVPGHSKNVFQLPGTLIPERAELIVTLFGERTEPRLLVLPARGPAVQLFRQQSDASFDLVNAVPDFAQTAITVADARGRIQDRSLLLYAQTTLKLAKSIYVPAGGRIAVQFAAGGQTYTNDIDSLEERRHYGIVLTGLAGATDPGKRARSVIYQFPDAKTCEAKVQSNVLLSGFLHAGPDLPPVDWGYVDAGGEFIALLPNVSFAAGQLPWVETPPGRGGEAVVRVGGSIVRSTRDDTISGCKLMVLVQPPTSSNASPILIPVPHS